MKQILTLTCFCLSFFACNTATEKNNNAAEISKNTEQVAGNLFFNYDAIDYYSSDLHESEISNLRGNKKRFKIESFKKGVILGDIPSSISDISFIDELEKIGYEKEAIDKSKFDDLNKIFVEKPVTENFVTACIYVYRDILIFKKNDNVVGIAKICFDCEASKIIGANAYTGNFGMDGDYGKLEDLLSK